MNEFALKYGCNPNQKPSRIYMENGGPLPVTILNGDILTNAGKTFTVQGGDTVSVTYRVRTRDAYRISEDNFRATVNMAHLFAVTGSVPVEPVPEGPYLLDLQLYWIGEDGVALRNADMDNLHFGADGRYTSGNEELDGLIRGILAEIYEEGMSREELLRAAYLHTRDSYSYLRREPFAFGDTSWLVDEAIALITTGRGNCYSYAAVFCELARAIGYDAVIYSGTFGANLAPHAWVEIVREDGEPHIFDVEIEMARKYNAGVEEDHYDLSYEDAEVYTYIRERKYYYW